MAKKQNADRSCTLKFLSEPKQDKAAALARQENPANAPFLQVAGSAVARDVKPEQLVVLTQKYWGSKGVDLGVAFLDITSNNELKAKILHYMNLWNSKGANIRFREASKANAQVRILRENDGYWSYLGTDVLSIPKNEATMNLDSFSLSTPDAEYSRVVTHETGHTLGFPHEHLRGELIKLLDRQKTIEYFRRTYGWSENMTISNVLTPLSESSIMGSTQADQDSVMCYMLPGSITKNGQPLKGGAGINPLDYETVAGLYPGTVVPPEAKQIVITYEGDAKNFKIAQG